MKIYELIILAFGVSMDAFAVSICKGLSTRKLNIKDALSCGAWFGGFQAIMPLIGFYLGTLFSVVIEKFDHWVAFGLLFIIGANMLKEAFTKKLACEVGEPDFSFKTMFIMAVATSIDALAVGISLAMAGGVNIFLAILFIGLVTLIMSMVGVKIGSVLGDKFEKKAQFIGGVILILIGVKILLEHLAVI